MYVIDIKETVLLACIVIKLGGGELDIQCIFVAECSYETSANISGAYFKWP